MLIIVGIVLLGFHAYKAYLASERRKYLKAIAMDFGLNFSSREMRGFRARFPNITCLNTGGDRRASNLIFGLLNGREILAFDYEYRTGWLRNGEVRKFSAVIIDAGFQLQPLSIRPEGLSDKINAFFGIEDINFESAEFSRKFFVTSPDKKWAYDVINQQTMSLLLSIPDCRIQFANHSIIAWQSFRFMRKDFRIAIELLQGILDRMPEYLVQQQMEQ